MIKSLLENSIGIEIDTKNLTEVRVRKGLPIVLSYGVVMKTLNSHNKEILGTSEIISSIIATVTENSFYAFEDKFARGFVDYQGAKIAICGEGVYKNKQLISFKNITSLAIRIPRAVLGVADKIVKATDNGELSCLIIGKTATGKTTILRDFAHSIKGKNIVVIDERGEIYLGQKSLGEYADILESVDKETGIMLAIRGLNPDIIICDELYTYNEMQEMYRCKLAGISVISTYHGDNIQSILNSKIFVEGVFDRFVVLEKTRGRGDVFAIYDNKGERI